jgi:hypothetical protein
MNSHQRRITKRFKQRTTIEKLSTWKIPIIASLIKKCTPTLIAYNIAGVQPMTEPVGKIHTLRVRYNSDFSYLDWKFKIVSRTDYSVNETYTIPDGYLVIDVIDTSIQKWIKDQPIHLWKEIESTNYAYDRYFITEELCTYITLKWA